MTLAFDQCNLARLGLSLKSERGRCCYFCRRRRGYCWVMVVVHHQTLWVELAASGFDHLIDSDGICCRCGGMNSDLDTREIFEKIGSYLETNKLDYITQYILFLICIICILLLYIGECPDWTLGTPKGSAQPENLQWAKTLVPLNSILI